ncbi:gamma-glutamyltransferase [Palleronia caenipelagi]|uniref:Glutathione hydrolase proenzyme n=1 Tax=Palleronia caenipelagi TaxID=2489174 RepID=A0A547Q755_9RHOB|nr:gamma-glutamyltransferase [Palleronia caenipelagi]TRD22215.1 gamma-glutamyltransferase [Palleronia caenipelagi]
MRRLYPLALLLALPAHAQQAADAITTEGTSETAVSAFATLPQRVQDALAAKDAGRPVTAENWMVAAANPLAVEAGAKILEQGGSAADAMVAVQTVLGLVEPQSSGLGGGAFLVWYDAASGELTTLDGRETAPLAARPEMFQDENGETMGFYDAVVGGRSVGTPGTPALMQMAHDKWGKLDWAPLFADATALARDGFAISPRLAGLVAGDQERLTKFPATAAYFYPDGEALTEGATLTNDAYAQTLETIASGGADAFYTGEIAQGIVDTVQSAEGNPGVLDLTDLAIYQVRERPAICATYRAHDVCGMGPPSSGALTVGQILGLLDGFDLSGIGPTDPDFARLLGDASRLAFADRGLYMADSDYVPMPTKGLVDPAYLASRAEVLKGGARLEATEPGNPEWSHAMRLAPDQSIEFPSTSHITIVDGDGNVLSMTTTIENGFGSRLMAPGGFLLNNELTDFSFATQQDGRPIANRLEPGKRPRSSMSPTIVMKDGKPVLAIGSPGGSRIIGYVAQAIVNHLDFGMDVQQAIAAPHMVNRFGTYDLEDGTDATALQEPLIQMGYDVSVRDLTSGLHAIRIGETLEGGADPRREGVAVGG